MNLSLLAALAVGVVGAQDRVSLERTYGMGEKAKYEFSNRLDMDFRTFPHVNYFPVRYLVSYSFDFNVEALKPDGVADVRFLRPSIVIRESESPWGDAKTETIELKENVLYTLSRANQPIGVKVETPADKRLSNRIRTLTSAAEPQLDIVGPFVSQIYQLAGFVNFFDLGPNLPLRPVAVGDTWKETKAYAPMTVESGADRGKNMVARLDYEYTFKGSTEFEGKQVTWIQGRLKQDTDAVGYIAELYGYEVSAFPISSIILKLDMTVDYYLDEKTKWPIKIIGNSQGEASITFRGEQAPREEIKVKGSATLARK